MELLTSAETADYLRLKERKLYELVATGAVPCTKVTGRWLFPKAELDRWIAAALAQPVGLMPAEPPRIIGGSHDPLLEWALRESGSALATLPEGSERGLERFLAGEVVAAAIHLHTLEGTGTDANVEAVRRSVQTHDAVLIAFVRREQGFVVAHGNPLDLSAIADVVERRVRLALRPKGAGAQLLLLALLHRAGAPFEAIAHGPVCPTGPDIAQAIRAGHADCGIATRSVANAAGLGFVPIMWEDFDLLLHQRDYFRAPMQAFFRFLSSSEFKARAHEAGGYDVSRGGQVRFAP
jgi:putative molybdopterin biosynthesis protein